MKEWTALAMRRSIEKYGMINTKAATFTKTSDTEQSVTVKEEQLKTEEVKSPIAKTLIYALSS